MSPLEDAMIWLSHMREFCDKLLRVQNINALDLCDAAAKGDVDRVESLLASGVDPNARWDDLAFPLSAAADDDDWASREKSAQPPIVFCDFTETPALGLASQDGKSSYPDKRTTARIMTALLQHGADPYALYRQPIYTYRDLPLFPVETKDSQFDTEEIDLLALSNNRRTILHRELQLHRRQQLLTQGVPSQKADECLTVEEIDYDNATEFESRLPLKYGVFSVLHSLLEGGMFILPVLNFFGDRLDIERRDPQGLTPFLSACRSALGLDAAIDGTYKGLTLNHDTRGLYENPYPQPNNPWRELERHGSTTLCSGPSLLEYFVSRGANLLAVDNYGKNALHQLFECIDRVEQNIPGIIDNGLRYLTTNCRALVNQPDYAGSHPLHLAIRRMGACWRRESFPPEVIYRFETVVDELLASGADALARDGLGNTVLHYLAATRLGENDRMGDEQRRLLKAFLNPEVGVDATARNAAGVSALEIFLSTGDDDIFYEEYDLDRYNAIGEEVIGAFEQAGYILAEPNGTRETLLHVVAGLGSGRAYEWFKILRAKGLDPLSKNKEGRTAYDIAKENDDLRFTDLFRD